MKMALLFVIAVFSIPYLASWDWPDEPDRIISSFGMSWGGDFERGLRFRAVGQRVAAWHSGELIWISQSDNSSDIPGQSIIVLEHENGFRSVYSGLESRPNINRSIGRGEWIGYADKEAWQFQIIDTQNSRIVNPAILLPQKKYSGNWHPIEARISVGNTMLPIQNDMLLPPGNRNLSLMGIVPTIIPIKLVIYWRNQETSSILFDTLVSRNNTVLLENPFERTYQDVYDSYNRLIIRNILPDSDDSTEGTLMVKLEGARGNTYTWNWRLYPGGRNNENIFQDSAGR